MNLLKKDVAGRMAEKMECTKKDAMLALETAMEVIAESLEEGVDVKLVGFGKFYVSEINRKSYTLPNGDVVEADDAIKTVRFKASGALKKAV